MFGRASGLGPLPPLTPGLTGLTNDGSGFVLIGFTVPDIHAETHAEWSFDGISWNPVTEFAGPSASFINSSVPYASGTYIRVFTRKTGFDSPYSLSDVIP